MYSFGLLETGCYYLVQEKKEGPVELIKPTALTDYCMYIFTYADQLVSAWKRKTDPIYDIIECLSDEMVEEWEKHYNSNEQEYYGDEE